MISTSSQPIHELIEQIVQRTTKPTLLFFISLFFVSSALLFADSIPSWDFQKITSRAEKLYGSSSQAQKKINDWQRLLDSLENAEEPEQLKAVNRFFNLQLRFRDDIEIWGEEDYWATPVEALYKGAGDCEDYAIAKYFTLKQLGVSGEKLRITYVKALQLDQAHMVLTYYPHPSAVPLVLDNLIDSIEPASKRGDLRPVYSFNVEGMWLPGRGSGKQVGDSKRLSRWQNLLQKMRAEGFP